MAATDNFERTAGWAALGLAAGGIAYSAVFVAYLHSGSRPTAIADAVILMVGGVVASMVVVALYERLRNAAPGFALWGAAIGVFAGLATSLHGGYDLAVAVKRLSGTAVSQTDPRGLATFGLSALAVLVLSWLMTRTPGFPPRLGRLGMAAAGGLLLTYIGRITLLNPHRSVLLALLVVVGFVLTPAWYLWVGSLLAFGNRKSAGPAPGTTVDLTAPAEGQLELSG